MTSTLDSSPSPAQNPDPAGAGNTRHPGRAPRWVRGVYIANLVAQSGIILTGAIVRITGSGLGCPTWPECVEGSYVPTNRQAESWHKYVEFGNRLLTFVLAAAAIAAIVAALVDRHRRRTIGLERRTALTVLACVPLAGTVVQAVLGGITVLTGLNPATVAAHFLVSMALVAVCVLLVVRSGEVGDTPVVSTVHSGVRLLTWGLVAATAVVVFLGVVTTGSGPHSGDAEVEARFFFDPRTVAWLHADSVFSLLWADRRPSRSRLGQPCTIRPRPAHLACSGHCSGAGLHRVHAVLHGSSRTTGRPSCSRRHRRVDRGVVSSAHAAHSRLHRCS